MFYFNTDSFTLSENPRSIAARHIYEAKYKSARKHTSGFEENEEFKNSKLSLIYLAVHIVNAYLNRVKY